MKRRPASVCAQLILSALACLLVAAAHGGVAHAQEAWPAAGSGDLQAGTTRKVDDYGKVGHCDETARLDYLAITIQNEPGTKAYLLVYMGRNDMPAWKEGLMRRAADYLVNARGVDPARVKVIFGGFREERTTELWVVAGEDPAPEPSDTVEVKVDRTKAYQWDDKMVEVEFNYEVEGQEGVEEEGLQEADAEDKAASETEAEAKAPAETEAKDKSPSETERANEAPEEKLADPEEASAAEWRKEVEKYEIVMERRGVIEEEEGAFDPPEAEASEAAASEAAEGEEVSGPAEAEAAAEPEEPTVGTIKVSLWWNVESFAEALKADPNSRACLVYYYGAKNADKETVREMLARAVAKMGEQFGLKGDRIVTVDGGYTPNPSIELWVVPRGAEPPKPKPNKRWNIGFYSAPGEE